MKKICLLLFCLCCFASLANAEDGRFVVDVSVDVTDKSASIARERAMAEANRAAFVEVVGKITDTQGASKLSAMPVEHLVNFIKEVAVLDEKSSAVRYIATLRITFNQDLLKTYMHEQNIPFLLQTSNSIMVVPVYVDVMSSLDENNLWSQAWKLAKSTGNVVFKDFFANSYNSDVMSVDDALSLNDVALKKIYSMNGVDDVYIAVAEKTPNGIDIKLHSYINGSNAFEPVGSISGDYVWSHGVDEVIEQIVASSRKQEILQNQESHEIVLLYDYVNLKDLINMENRLKNIAYVKNLQMDAVGGNRVQYKLTHIGSIDKFESALREKGLSLEKYDNFFVLQKI